MRLINLVDTSAQLRQGDVLSMRGKESTPYDAVLSVVITADCDLAQAKHYGQVLLCPIISASAYYENIWCVKRLENFREKIFVRLRKEFNELADRKILSSPLSDQALITICETEAALRTSLNELGLPSGKIDELAHIAISLEKCSTTTGNLLSLIAGSAHSQKKDVSTTREKLFLDFKADLAKDAIDIVAMHDDLSGDDVIHVVLLRAPFSIPAKFISLSAGEKGEAECFRQGRFAPEIKFLIAQKFGTLFSRVGLKNEIEIDRNAAIELLRDIT